MFVCCCALQAQSTQQAKNATLTVTGAVSWRRPGLKYSKNEVFLDIVEEVNLLMSSTGGVTGAQWPVGAILVATS
jgi:AP-2 complex subunit mu-1